MKKLLVLALVLAVSTIASAAFLPIIGTDGVAINASSASIADTVLIIASNTEGFLSNFAKGPFAPVNAEFAGSVVDAGFPELGFGEVWGMADFAGTTQAAYPNGIWLTASILAGYTADQTGPVVVTFYELDSQSVLHILGSQAYSIPEPITVALLGLGGLFIRRRKIC